MRLRGPDSNPASTFFLCKGKNVPVIYHSFFCFVKMVDPESIYNLLIILYSPSTSSLNFMVGDKGTNCKLNSTMEIYGKQYFIDLTWNKGVWKKWGTAVLVHIRCILVIRCISIQILTHRTKCIQPSVFKHM